MRSTSETDILPDMSQELASMGRGSMARRIAQLEDDVATAKQLVRDVAKERNALQEALTEAKEALAGIAADDNTWQGQEAKAALVLIAHMLGGK